MFRGTSILALAISLIARQAFSQIVHPRIEGGSEFSITAGNAFFDQGPALGALCTFDFGDPRGKYNVLTGFNAAHIYQTPGDYTLKVSRIGTPDAFKTIHVLPDKRSIVPVTATDNLADIVRGLQNDTIVALPAGATFDVTGAVDIKARNVEFRATGPGEAPRICRIAGNGSSSLLVHGLDITFRGIEFDSDKEMKVVGNEKVNIRAVTADSAHVILDHCKFRNVDDAVFCTPLTRGLLVQDCTFTTEVRSCDVWCGGSSLSLLGNTMLTSQREHNCRQSSAGFYNLLVYGNDMTATHGKETLTFRDGQDLYASHNLFKGWVRVGPGPRADHRPITPEELKKTFVKYAIVEHNEFLSGAYMQINEGSSEVAVRCNRFDADAEHVPVRAQGPSLVNIVLENNYRVLTAGPTEKPFFRGWTTGPQDVSEKGTTTTSAEEADKAVGINQTGEKPIPKD